MENGNGKRILTTSAARSFRRCPREYQFAYLLGYRPAAVDGPRAFGHLIHKGLEAWFKTEGVDGRLRAVRDALQETDANKFDRVIAIELLRGYHFRWKDEPLQPVAVEATFEAPLVNPDTGASSRTWTIGGKFDLLAEARCALWLVEHKTSSEDITPGSAYWQKLKLDTQISTYFVGAKELGHDPVGCIYDVIFKPRMRPLQATKEVKLKKDGTPRAGQRLQDETLEEFGERLRNDIAENPDKYYQRGEVYRLRDEETDAAYDMWQIAKLIRESELATRWPRNTDSCFKYNRVCDFWPVCSGEATLDDPIRYRKIEEVNEELQEENDGKANATADCPY
jgi:hypothetical protein